MPTTSQSSRINCSSARMTAGSSSSTWGLGACNLRTLTGHGGTVAKCMEMHSLLLRDHCQCAKCTNIRIGQAESSGNIRSPKDAGTPSLTSASYPARLVESGLQMSPVWPSMQSYDQHLVHALDVDCVDLYTWIWCHMISADTVSSCILEQFMTNLGSFSTFLWLFCFRHLLFCEVRHGPQVSKGNYIFPSMLLSLIISGWLSVARARFPRQSSDCSAGCMGTGGHWHQVRSNRITAPGAPVGQHSASKRDVGGLRGFPFAELASLRCWFCLWSRCYHHRSNDFIFKLYPPLNTSSELEPRRPVRQCINVRSSWEKTWQQLKY